MSPFTKFLGVDADASPLDLLGLRPQSATLAHVVQALEHRLSRIAVHAESRTPAADEVRLALHAAAAQLLDPRTREQLVATAPAVNRGDASYEVDAPPALESSEYAVDEFAAPDEIATSRFALRADAILVLAMNGGWNDKALRDLSMYAHARGLTADDAAVALTELASGQVHVQRHSTPVDARRPPAPRKGIPPEFQSNTPPAPRPVAIPEQGPSAPTPRPVAHHDTHLDEHSDPLVKMLLLGVGIAFVLLVLVLGVLLLSSPATPNNTAQAPDTTQHTTRQELFPTDHRAAPAAPKAAPVPLSEAQSLTREIAACSTGLAVDPEQAATHFAAIIDTLSRRWTDWPRDELTAAHSAIIQFIYDASATIVSSKAADAITAAVSVPKPLWAQSPADITRSAWGVGMLARLIQERGLPAGLIESLRRAYASAAPDAATLSEPTFEGGVALALPILADQLIPPPDTADDKLAALPALWTMWRRAGEAALGSATPRTHRLELIGLEYLLSRGPDATAHKPVADTIDALVTTITWREADESRRWLLRWFDSPNIRTAQLHTVTAALATKSGAPGVSVNMVLSAGADARERALVKGQYTKAWNLDVEQDKGVASERLIAIATRELTTPAPGTPSTPTKIDDAVDTLPPIGELVQAVTLSRLNEAAQLLWLGQAAASASILEHPEESAQVALTKAATHAPVAKSPFEGDSPWAAKYLALGANAVARADMLRQMAAASSLGPVDIEIVAADAMRSGSPQVRAAARDIIKRHFDEPVVVNALLELLPTVGITPDNAELYSVIADTRTPPVRDPQWRPKVRRALVERLLQLIAGSSDFGGADALSQALAASYVGRAGDQPATTSNPDVAPPPPPPADAAARTFRERLDHQADSVVASGKEHLPLAEIRRRAQARLDVASGLIQRFAAEQVTAVDLFAYTLVAEEPARAPAVNAIMQALASDRRHAAHILVQIRAAEQASLKLWLLRFGREIPAPTAGGPQ